MLRIGFLAGLVRGEKAGIEGGDFFKRTVLEPSSGSLGSLGSLGLLGLLLGNRERFKRTVVVLSVLPATVGFLGECVIRQANKRLRVRSREARIHSASRTD